MNSENNTTHIKMNKYKQHYIQVKKDRREKKTTNKRNATVDEVFFIWEKILEGWKTIKIYNTIKQTTPNTYLDKKKVETISTGNCKIYESEVDNEKYAYYLSLREKVYKYHKNTNGLLPVGSIDSN